DEVVWSCWATPFAVAGDAVAAAPLPYLEPFYTPRAIPRTRPPQDFKRADELLRSALATLPVPLVGLPPVVHPPSRDHGNDGMRRSSPIPARCCCSDPPLPWQRQRCFGPPTRQCWPRSLPRTGPIRPLSSASN